MGGLFAGIEELIWLPPDTGTGIPGDGVRGSVVFGEAEDAVGVLAALNALCSPLMAELSTALKQFDADPVCFSPRIHTQSGKLPSGA